MNYLGAEHNYFWKGVMDLLVGREAIEYAGPGLGTHMELKCLQAYLDGYDIAEEMEPKEILEIVYENKIKV